MPPTLPAAWKKVFERQAARSPSAVSLALSEGSSATMRVTCGPDDPPGTNSANDNLAALLTTGLEHATTSTTHPGLVRTLPVAHPRWYWMFLERISNIQGAQFDRAAALGDDGLVLEAPALPQYGRYQEYELDLTFQPRPYAVLDDSSITALTFDYWDARGGTAGKHTVTVKREWDRYTEWDVKPSGEYLTCQLGQYTLVDPVNGRPKDGRGGVDGVGVGRGDTKILVSSRHVLVRWYRVPYRYVLSPLSYFDSLQGHVNQRPWEGYPAGTLLLQGTNVLRVYAPTFPDVEVYTGNEAVSQERLCDLEFQMLYKDWVPKSDPGTPQPNPSHIPAGHNLVPWGGRRDFYYVVNSRPGGNVLIPPALAGGLGAAIGAAVMVAITGTVREPLYPSLPFELLFQNPEVKLEQP